MFRHACAIVALLGLFLQGSSAGHFWLVEHAKCPEHGELIHGDVTHHQASASTSATVAVSSREAPASQDHEHCLEAADRRDAAAPIEDARLLHARLGARTTGGIVDGERSDSPTPLLHLAPKTSPPALA